MKIYIYLLLMLVSLHTLAVDPRDLDLLIKEKDFHGVVLISHNHETILHKAYGFSNIHNQKPNLLTTKFGIGSISKQFTATAILLLQEEGKIEVKEKISKYVEVPEHWQDITTHHLLTHTAALVRDIPQPDEDFDKFHTAKELFEITKAAPLLPGLKPGESYVYSNSAYSVLAHLIEVLSGVSYAEFLQERIFRPAGMFNTGVVGREAVEGMGDGHIFKNDEYYEFVFEPEYYSNFIGSGNIYSTAEDMLKWMRIVQNRGILSLSSWDQVLARHQLAYQNDTNTGYYGYGWILDNFLGDNCIWHDGSLAGFRSDASYLTNNNYISVILSNVRTDLVSSLSVSLVRKTLNKPQAP